MKLISLNEFVLKESAKEWSGLKRLSLIIAYAEFLNTKINQELIDFYFKGTYYFEMMEETHVIDLVDKGLIFKNNFVVNYNTN